MRALLLLTALLYASPCLGRQFFFNGRYWNDRTSLGILKIRNQNFPAMWFNQTLDHFGSDGRLWAQRYFVNKQYYRPGGPAFLMIGGEGTANPIWMNTGSWIELAKEVGAICFMLEHRYYGKSHPTPDMSTSNLKWLSSRQALADLAAFRNAMADEHNLQTAKWVSFGGSYPGSLSAWFRLKYPNLVDAAVATSAPLQALVDFQDYNVVAGQSISTEGGTGCYLNISYANYQIKKLIEDSAGMKVASELFKLCEPLNSTNPNDTANFFSSLAGNFEGVVQYNRDNRAFEGALGTNITISTLCSLMTTPGGESIDKYAAVNNLMLTTNEQSCLDINYKTMIKELQETSWTSSAASGARQWTYQTCNEFGFYQSSDAKQQPFGDGFPVGFSVQQCIDIYGRDFNMTRLEKAINSTNTYYGAKNYNGTKVIFVNGSIDPWHALGLVDNGFINERLVIYIEGTAHCANMYPPSNNDPPQLVAARQMIDKTLKFWLQA